MVNNTNIVTILLTIMALLADSVGAAFGQSRPSEPAGIESAGSGVSAEKWSEIRSIVQAAVDKRQTPGAVVLIARRGTIAHLESFGSMDIDAHKPMRPDTIFRIYSMTKPITSVAALMLVEEGKMRLDDPVSKYLPEFGTLRVYAGEHNQTVAAQRGMTILDLMRHTSGLTYGIGGTPVDRLYVDNKVESGTLDEMIHKLAGIPLLNQPGAKFTYSVSTDVLGRIIEIVSAKPLDEFLRDHIFRSLGMRDTGFVVEKDKLDRFATSYSARPDGSLAVVDAPAKSPYRTRPRFLSGGGGLVSTGQDYFRFCQMLLGGGEIGGRRLLRPATVRQMTTNQLPAETLPMSLSGFPLPGHGFGLGVLVQMGSDRPEKRPSAGEFGWSGAASTYFWVAPDPELIVIILQQVQPFNVGLQLALKPVIYAGLTE